MLENQEELSNKTIAQNMPNNEILMEIQQFLTQIDELENNVNITSLEKTNDEQKTQIDNQASQNDSTISTTSNNDALKVRIVRKNDLDGDVNASLRNPMSDATQSRIVEKNNLEGNVEADLRETIYEYKDEKPRTETKPTQVEEVIKTTMSISNVTVTEGNTAIFTVNFDKASNKPFKVNFFPTTNETADSTDINPNIIVKDSKGNVINKNSDGSYTVPTGETSLKVEIGTTNDTHVEGNETFRLNGKTEFMNSTVSGVGTIVDDDKPVLTLSDATIEEGSTIVFEGTLSNASEYAEEITLSTSLGSAESNDFSQTKTSWTVTYVDSLNVTQTLSVDVNGKFTLPAGITSFNVNIPTTSDSIYEGAETFTLSANATSSYITDSDTAIGTITDNGSGSDGDDSDNSVDNDKPVLTLSDATMEEGSTIVFVGTLSNASEYAEEITLSTSLGSAESNDFSQTKTSWTVTYVDSLNVTQTLSVDVNGKFTLPAGITSFNVNIPTTSDSIYEGAETFTLSANATSSYITDSDTAIGTITDNGTGTDGDDSDSSVDNDKPVLTLSDATIEEGSTLVFVGTLSNASEYAEEITLSTSLGSAENNDFSQTKTSWTVTYVDSLNVTQTLSVDVNGKFTLPAGITSFNVNIPTTSDSIYEGAETFTLSANATSSYITDSDTAIGTITDNGTGTDGDDSDSSVDDDRTKFSISDAEAYEGASNTITFVVSRIGDAEANQTVDYAATIETGNSAESGDFTAGTNQLSGTITFLPGETNKTIILNVPVDADNDIDTFTVTLSNNSAGSSILDGTAIGTIKESNTIPEGADKTVSLGKNSTHVLSSSDFGFTDVDGDSLSKVKITSLATNGKLLYFDGTSWTEVSTDQEITKTAIDNGYLVFKPDTNEVGIPYANFQFLVNDGTAYDDDANTITYDIGNTLNVSNPLPVDEGKSAVFVISLDEARNENTILDLNIGGVDSSTDYDNTLYYKKWANDGQSWSWEVVTSNKITLLQGQTSVEIKVKTLTDSIADDAESLTLTATINGGSNADMANITATGSTTINDYPSLVIDTKPYINEGDYAVFELSLSSPKSTDTIVTLNGAGTASWGVDYSQNYEYSTDDGLTWQTISNFTVTIPGSLTTTPSVLIRTQTTNDNTTEPDETVTLIASTTDTGISTKNVSTTTTIVDKVNLTVYEDGDDTNLSAQSNSVTLTATSEYTYTILGQGLNGTVTQSGNNLIYTPTNDFSGSDSFTYIKTNVASGLEIVGTANVTVNANADTPIININLSNKVLSTGTNILINGNLDSALSTNNGTDGNWYGKQSPGNSGKSITASQDKTLTQVVDSGTDKSVSLSGEWMIQNVRVPLAQDNATYSVTFTITGTGTDGKVSWIGNIANGATEVVIASGLSAGTYTFTIPASATIGSDTTYNALVFTGNSIKIDDVSLISNSSNNYTYDVNISNSLVDIDGSETLSSVTISGVPTGATFNQGTNNNDGTWTFTQAQLSGLKITTTSTNFTLTSTVHSIDGTSTSPNATDSVTINNTNLLPLIGDQTLHVTNGNVNTNGSNISTTYGDGTNLFSWDVANTRIPELYANGQKVVITYDNVNHTVTGTIDNGTTEIFKTTITMADSNGTTLNYTQGSTLLGVVNMIDGDILLPGGGNQDYRIFQFTQSSTNSTVVVDALVTAHNLIEDSLSDLNDSDAEHTVNTNNYYIGVDSNNMNAGQQLIFDFNTIATYDGITTTKNEISEINIKLFNFGSEKSGDELFITVITTNGRENILLTDDSFYTPDLEYTVRSSNGDPIIGVEFLAGNNSSFKLGIESIGSINYNDTFEMKYAYDITDADGDNDSGLTTITVGNGTVNTSLDYELDSKIVFDSTDKVIDGGTGTDTLILDAGIDIDFATYTNDINNIEEIDMTNSSATNDLSNIAFQDVIDITSSNNLLKILGDTGDTVSLDNTGGNWSTNGNIDTEGFKTYVNSGDNSVSLKIDKDITVSGLI